MMQLHQNKLSQTQIPALQSLLDSHLGETFPAFSLAVIYRGEWLVRATAGWVDAETRQIPVTPDTRFDLASVTKLFTETAFLQCISAGRVKLDDPVVSVIPEFGASGLRPLDGGQDPHTRVMLPTPDDSAGQAADPTKVTFHHLLTHSSGLAPWRDVFNAAGEPPPPPTEHDPIPRTVRWQRGLDAICHYPFVGQPGDAVRYSDLGLMLVGEAVTRLTSAADLSDAVNTNVTQPLSLKSAVFNPAREHGIPLEGIAPTEYDDLWRHRRVWGEVHDENACGVGGVAGHAGLFATAEDVARFGQAWLSQDSALQISPELMQDAVREHRRNGFRFGLGWMIKAVEDSSASEWFSTDSYGHTGFTGTSLWIDPEKQLVAACLTNRVYPGRQRAGIHEFRKAVHALLAQSI